MLCANFQAKRTTLNFSNQICPEMELGLEIQKANVWMKMNILEILCMPIFRQKGHFLPFLAQIFPKIGFGVRISKAVPPRFRIRFRTSKIPCVPIFSQNGQLWIFGPKFGQIPQLYAIYYCSNDVESVPESWVEVRGSGWSCVEVGTWFRNTRSYFSLYFYFSLSS